MKCWTAHNMLDTDRPDPGLINLEDIAASLAGILRWRGLGVSVAQHSSEMARAAPPRPRRDFPGAGEGLARRDQVPERRSSLAMRSKSNR